jgi:hypothetical protein
MPKETHKWLPKFTGNNVVMPKYHLYVKTVALLNEGVEREDVVVRLLAMSLDEDAHKWLIGLPDNHLTSYEDFSKLLAGIWSTNKDIIMLLAQFNQIKKKENKIMKEFDTRFDKLYDQIPADLRPPTTVIRALYMNAFEGQFAFIFKDKARDILEKG